MGIVWDHARDVFTLETNALAEYCFGLRHRATLRTVLSITARVYDVLGLISPVVILTRILMQRIWRKRLDWDQEFPVEMQQEFWIWVDNLPKIVAVHVPRWYFHGQDARPQQVELHVFCDASEKAYGAVAYIRIENYDGAVTVTIAAIKARVAPVQPPTLPRLELLGGHLAVRLAEQIKNSLGHLNLTTFY